jgi:hypothetical protein
VNPEEMAAVFVCEVFEIYLRVLRFILNLSDFTPTLLLHRSMASNTYPIADSLPLVGGPEAYS